MSLLNTIISFLGELHIPYNTKKFDTEHYFDIEKRIREFGNPLIVGLVKTYGNGSNILICLAQSIAKNKTCRVTHALAHIGVLNGYKHRVVESVGKGIQEVSLLTAISQRDEVVLRVPNPEYLSETLCNHAIEYIQEVAKRDAVKNMEYDQDHDYSIVTIEDLKDYTTPNVKFDCSETIFQSLEHGYRMTGKPSDIKMVSRAGKKSWSPGDIYYSDLFKTFYDSRKGFIEL